MGFNFCNVSPSNGMQNISVLFNVIGLLGIGGGIGFGQSGHNNDPGYYTGQVEGNIFTTQGSGDSIHLFYTEQATNSLSIRYNSLNAAGSQVYYWDSNAPTQNICDNFGSSGAFAGNFGAYYFSPDPQTELPNGATRVSLTASSYNASYADYYIGIKATSGDVTVVLPNAVGHPGKEIVLADEIASSNSNTYQVQSNNGNLINGTNSVRLTRYTYNPVTFVSDGANWFYNTR